MSEQPPERFLLRNVGHEYIMRQSMQMQSCWCDCRAANFVLADRSVLE